MQIDVHRDFKIKPKTACSQFACLDTCPCVLVQEITVSVAFLLQRSAQILKIKWTFTLSVVWPI